MYIGKNGCSIKTRHKKHQRCLRSSLLLHSAVAEHQHDSDHQIFFDSPSVGA